MRPGIYMQSACRIRNEPALCRNFRKQEKRIQAGLHSLPAKPHIANKLRFVLQFGTIGVASRANLQV